MRLLLSLALLLLAVPPSPAQTEKIYLAPDDHTDYMWTANEEGYRKAILDMTDFYLDLTDRTLAEPAPFQSRWNMDGALWMWIWENNRSPDQVERLAGRIRDGHFSMPLNFVVSTYGGMPTEAVLRSMYYAGKVERRYHLQLPIAVAMEDQTLPIGLAGLWTGSGARYSWRGVCACATKLAPVLFAPRPHEIYWMQAPDGSRILMKWYSTSHEWHDAPDFEPGGYAEARRPAAHDDISVLDKNDHFRSKYPYKIYGFFGEGWDNLSTMNDSFLVAAKKLTRPGREVIVSNEQDFFRDFEAHYGNELPTEKVSFGNDWDTLSSSMQEVTSGVRRATERLRTAEAMESLVTLARPDFPSQFIPERDEAWTSYGLYWEHNWTSDNKTITRTIRGEWQRKIAGHITTSANDLTAQSAAALGGMIAKKGAAPRFFVFNPLSWSRTDAADLPYEGPATVHVVDLVTGKTVPSQFVDLHDEQGQPQRRLRILAAKLPPVGYKVYEIRPGKQPDIPGGPTAQADRLENSLYRVHLLANGSIDSVISKALGNRELIASVDGRLANDLGSGEGSVRIVNAGPVSITLEAQTLDELPHTTQVTLYRDIDRIAIRNEITGNFSAVKTWAFSFNLTSPDVWHEELGAVLHARQAPQGDYSTKMARLDWLTLNHFVAMSGTDGVGITLSNSDDAFFKLGKSNIEKGVTYLDTSTPQISVLAGGQIDGPSLGIPDEGGDQFFLQRFSLRLHQVFNAADSMRFSLEDQNPPFAGTVTGGDAYPETSYSLLTVSNHDALLWVLKPAEEGAKDGLVARIWNVAPQPATVKIKLQNGISSARAITHLETDATPLPSPAGALNVPLKSWQMRSLEFLPRAQIGPRRDTIPGATR